MSFSKTYQSILALLLAAFFVFALNFFWPIWPVRNPDLPVAIRDCITKSDYICILKLAHANPPDDRRSSSVGVTADDRKQEFLWKTTITLGLLGESEMALNIYRNQYYGSLHHYILSAVIANYFVTGQDEKAHGLLSEINSHGKKIKVLSGVQSYLHWAQPSLREKTSALLFDHVTKNHTRMTNKRKWYGVMYKFVGTHSQELKSYAEQNKDASTRKYILNWIDNEGAKQIIRQKKKEKILRLARSANIYGLKREISLQVVNPAKPNETNKNLDRLIKDFWLSEIVESSNIPAVETFVNASLGVLNLDDDKTCITMVYAALAKMYARAGDRKKGLSLVNQARKYFPPIDRKLLSKGTCAGGEYASIHAIIARLGGIDEFQNTFIREAESSILDAKNDKINISVPLLVSSMGTAIFETPKSRIIILNYYLKVTHYGIEEIQLYAYWLAIEKSLFQGDPELAMEYAGIALSKLPEENKVEIVTDHLLPSLTTRTINTGWIYYLKKATR